MKSSKWVVAGAAALGALLAVLVRVGAAPARGHEEGARGAGAAAPSPRGMPNGLSGGDDVYRARHADRALAAWADGGMEQPPIAEHALDSMSVMNRAASAADRDAERVAAREIRLLGDTSGAPEAMWPGRAIDGSLRVLGSALGSSSATVYAFRTDRDRVCGGALGMAAGCFEGFPQDAPVNWTIGTKGDGTTVVFGFAPDRVRAVSAIVAGASHPALMTQNAFFIEITGVEPSAVSALVVTFADGGAQRVELGAPPRASRS